MAVIDRHDHPLASPSDNMCAVQFCLTWVGFFAVIGIVTWLASLL
jgi:hypothetical protein